MTFFPAASPSGGGSRALMEEVGSMYGVAQNSRFSPACSCRQQLTMLVQRSPGAARSLPARFNQNVYILRRNVQKNKSSFPCLEKKLLERAEAFLVSNRTLLLAESSKNFFTFGFVFPNVFLVILDRLDFLFCLPTSGCFFCVKLPFL